MHRWHRWTLLPLVLLLLCAVPLRAQWRKLAVYPNRFFNEVFFTDAAHGWFTSSDATVVRTANGGATWQTSTLPGATGSSNRDLCFLSASLGFVSGEDGLWKTTNGGASWTNITPSGASLNGGSAAMWFRSEQVGVWGMGSCGDTTVTFFSTSNGGLTWSSVSYNHSIDVAVGGIVYSSGAFVVSGGMGKSWRSTDDGLTWSFSNTGSAGWQEDITASSSGLLLIASANGSSCGSTGGGKVLASTNGGTSWTSTSFPTAVMWGVTMYSATEGWACGDGGRAFKTTDGGTSWREYSCGMSSLDHLDDIFFTDATNGWAVGDGIYRYIGDTLTSRPDTIDFGDIPVGTPSSDSTARLFAFGTPLTVTARTISGGNADQFAINGASGSMVVPNCQEGLTRVYFHPTSSGVKIAELNYTITGYPAGPRVVLRGRGVQPTIQSTQIVTLDTSHCGKPVQRSIRITNTGNAPLLINSSSFAPSGAALFVVRSPLLPVAIDSGKSIDLVVEITPFSGARGPYTNVLSLSTNDTRPGVNPWTINLNGVIHQTSFTLTPAAPLLLPPVEIGEVSTTCAIYSNTGTEEQQIVEVTPLDSDPTIQHDPSAIGTRIAPGNMHSICFTGTTGDTAQHVRRFRVRIMPCTIDTIITVRLRASGATIVSQPSLSVLDTACAGDGRSEKVAVYNRGNAPLKIDAARIVGTDAARFRIVSPTGFPLSIVPGDSIVVEVLYTDPAERIDRKAQLELAGTNDHSLGGAPWRIALAGYREVRTLAVNDRVIDAGEICLDVPLVQRTIHLQGIGRAAALLSPEAAAIEVVDSAAHVTLPALPPVVAAGTSDSATLSIVPVVVGPFRSRVVIAHGSCPLYDTVTVVGRIVATRIGTPDTVRIGSIRVGQSGSRQIVVHNAGTTPATLSLSNTTPTGSLAVLFPALPVDVAAGDSVVLVVSATPSDTGQMAGALTLEMAGPCSDSATVVVLARGTLEAILPELPEVALGAHTGCGGSVPVVDSIVLRNYVDRPVRIESMALLGGAASPFLLTTPTLPYTIDPAGRVVAGVEVRSSALGMLTDTVLVVLEDGSRITIPIAGRIDRLETSVSDSSGQRITGSTPLPLPILTSCSEAGHIDFILENTGTVGDTFTVVAVGNGFRLLSAPQFALAPDSSGRISVEGALADSGSSIGTVTVRSVRCGVVQEFQLLVRYEPTRWELGEVVIDTMAVGETGSGAATVQNTGSTVITAGEAWLEDVDNASAAIVLGSVAGVRFTPAEVGKLPVSVTMNAQGTVNGTIALRIVEPCVDTLRIPLHAVAVAAEERALISLTADTTVGRWGTQVELPVRLVSRNGPRPTRFDLRVGVEARLLELRAVRVNPAHAGTWRVSLVERTTSSDSATVRVEAIGSSSPLPAMQDSFLLIECEVLRGDQVSSPITLRPDTVVGVRAAYLAGNGMFALADYCDAYGRLLRITNGVALRPAAPNPFTDQTVIEYETPFAGDVRIVLIDERGRETTTLVSGFEPAGRRRATLEGRGLPPGRYTCRMTIGLQRRETTIVHVR